jgi:hypothetical protein
MVAKGQVFAVATDMIESSSIVKYGLEELCNQQVMEILLKWHVHAGYDQ